MLPCYPPRLSSGVLVVVLRECHGLTLLTFNKLKPIDLISRRGPLLLKHVLLESHLVCIVNKTKLFHKKYKKLTYL